MPDPPPPSSAGTSSTTSPTFSCNVSLPPKIQLQSGNLSKEWKQWRQVWEAYEEVTDLRNKTSRLRVATFITCIGKEALEVHNGLPFQSEDEKTDINKVLELWQNHCLGKTNIIYERYKFNNRSQEQAESIDTYITSLRALAETCEFGALKEDLLRDRIVCGVRDKGIRRKLLQESGLTLSKCVDICRANEATTAQLKDMTPGQTIEQEANAVNQKEDGKKPKAPKDSGKGSKNQLSADCKFCGRKHERKRDKCPAYGQTCSACGKANHFAAKCLKNAPSGSKKKRFQRLGKKVHQLDDSTELAYSSEEEILSVSLDHTANTVDMSKFKSKIFAHMEIADELVKMQVDSGASCNVLPKKFLPKDSKIQKTDLKLTTYSKTNLKLLGVAKVSLCNPKNKKKYRVEFAVIDEDYTPLLGSSAAQQMGLITVQQQNILQVAEPVAQESYQELTMEKITTTYQDVFQGLGCMEGTLRLEVDKSVAPSIMPPRRVPLSLKERLKQELTRLERANVIKREEEPTDWVSSLVVTEKPNGKLRVCIDPQRLNTALKRSHYPLPVIEDILPELADVKVFSKADLKDGFLQIQLDEDSSKLTTFQTPWGRYRYLRMPFGISPAPECFQRKLDQNLEGLEGIYKVADDILITGRGACKEEAVRNHDANLLKLLERCRERNLKLNREKLQLKCTETTFIGHVLTPEGVKPDPSKVEAILKMERPSDVAAVRRLVGLTNYLSKFLSQLSELCEPLRRLTHKDVEWSWSAEQEKAFENVKQAVTSAPVLRYFNSSEPVEGQGDASANGIGFVLMQNGQPVSYSSRALTTSERNYSQIEKELLAQVFGVERNHQYVYGRKIVLWSDHKPLETICKKPLATAPKRLQRLLLRLQQYDVEIRYKPGPEMYLADTLSRAYLPTTGRSPAEEETERIHAVDFLPISEPQLAEIQRETATDSVLQSLTQVILRGWPDQKETLPLELHPYYMVRDELTVQDGILFKGLRCIIPVSLRAKIRERLNGAHTGVEGCLRRARETVYWPNMNANLRDYIAKCDVCATYQNDQQKEPLISHKIPNRPWETVGCDILHFDGRDYLCTVDYYSSYFEIDLLKDKTGKEVIHLLKKHFSTHGIPNKLMSDNGPPYGSYQFQQFMTSYDIEHVTSSPHYPQSNGKVENAVKIVKGLLKKSNAAGSDFYLALLTWRNTPTEGLESSPAQRMFSRRTRTLIPTTSELLKPKIVENISGKLLKRKQIQAKHYNISAKELPPLGTGEIVRVKPADRSGQWFKARVEQQVDVRSYEVWTEDGKIFRRNRRHLRNSMEPACTGGSPEPIHMPDRTQLYHQKVPPVPNQLSFLRKPVPLQSYHHPKELEEQPVPRNLRVVPSYWTCLNSLQPRNRQLIVQLPAAVVPQDHLVTLRTLF